MSKKQKKTLIRIIASAALFIAVFAAEKLSGGAISQPYIIFPLYLIPYLVAGCDVLAECARNIRNGRFLDEAFLMTVATLGAFALSILSPEHNEYAEAVFVMVFYQTGELFQSIAVGKSRKSISDLMNISPDTATVLRDGEETEVVPEEIVPGDILIIKPGEKIAVDGTVVSGESEIDTSALTGESVPAEIKEGDSVISGCVNLSAMIKVRAEKDYVDSTVAKILELIENSSLRKAKTELFLTKFARIYTPVVVGFAAVLALTGAIMTRQPAVWISRALIFLVVSCPCAIVISVPMAYFGGIGGASRKGILIKGSDSLEALSEADTFIFDKTGTLTNGKFSVTSLRPAEGITEDELLRLAAVAEYYSVHPVGLSIKAACIGGVPVPDSCENIPGRGIKAEIGEKTILAGNAEMMSENGVEFTPDEADGTTVYVTVDGRYYGSITLDDMPRDNAQACIGGLKKLGIRKFVMLTGDRTVKAEKTGRALGFEEIHSSLLPADKVRITEEICANHAEKGKVAFVGDGINDAPVLARADIGIAMGGIGSDAAIEASDIVIMNDDIGRLPEAMTVAVKTKSIIRQNIVFALTVKILVLILAALGLTNLWVGVFADVGVAVLCILNSMRALKHKEKKA